jgi:hypothetical protein
MKNAAEYRVQSAYRGSVGSENNTEVSSDAPFLKGDTHESGEGDL